MERSTVQSCLAAPFLPLTLPVIKRSEQSVISRRKLLFASSLGRRRMWLMGDSISRRNCLSPPPRSVTGRLGYTWGPALLYAKGGYAWRDSNNLRASVGGVPVAFTTATIPTATLSAPASNTCSRRTGPARLSTSTTISGAPCSRAAPPTSPAFVHGRRAYRQGWPELSVQLGWPGGRAVLIESVEMRTRPAPCRRFL
jgi:hypothetical protein